MSSASFESPEHAALFAEQLATRRTASKYMYAGSGVDLHQRLAREHPEEYEHGRAEQEVAALLRVVGSAVPQQVLDVGTSNGVHTGQLMRLVRDVQPAARLLVADFSAKMLGVAREQLASSGQACEEMVWDVEAGDRAEVASWRTDGRLLVCLLGNTLGNVEEPHEVLVNVAGSTEPGDLLLVSLYTAAEDDPEATVRYYEQPAIRELVLEPLRAAGVAEHDLRLHLVYGSGEVVGEAELLRSTRPMRVAIDAGERIRCFRSRRFDGPAADTLLTSSGWRPLHQDVSHGRVVVVAELR